MSISAPTSTPSTHARSSRWSNVSWPRRGTWTRRCAHSVCSIKSGTNGVGPSKSPTKWQHWCAEVGSGAAAGFPPPPRAQRSLSPISRFDCAGGSLLHRLRLVAPDLPVIQCGEGGRHVSPFIEELRSPGASTTMVRDEHDLDALRHVLHPGRELRHWHMDGSRDRSRIQLFVRTDVDHEDSFSVLQLLLEDVRACLAWRRRFLRPNRHGEDKSGDGAHECHVPHGAPPALSNRMRILGSTPRGRPSYSPPTARVHAP